MKNILLVIMISTVCSTMRGQTVLQGNAKEIIITPPLEWKYTLGGYGARMSKPAEAVHDDIKAKALIIRDTDKKYVIVTLDATGIPPNLRVDVARRLEGTGWSLENMMFLPSHSHTSLEMFAMNDKNVFKLV